MQNGLTKLLVRMAKFLAENERLLVVAASTMIMSLSHTALRPVLPTFDKVRNKTPRREAVREAPARFWKLWSETSRVGRYFMRSRTGFLWVRPQLTDLPDSGREHACHDSVVEYSDYCKYCIHCYNTVSRLLACAYML